eukprot:XP_001705850.1 Hypothetical protein GL50803_10589 [Giardia lamblia ATCC 50803]
MCASFAGDTERVKKNLSDKDKKNDDGETALMLAAENNRRHTLFYQSQLASCCLSKYPCKPPLLWADGLLTYSWAKSKIRNSDAIQS